MSVQSPLVRPPAVDTSLGGRGSRGAGSSRVVGATTSTHLDSSRKGDRPGEQERGTLASPPAGRSTPMTPVEGRSETPTSLPSRANGGAAKGASSFRTPSSPLHKKVLVVDDSIPTTGVTATNTDSSSSSSESPQLSLTPPEALAGTASTSSSGTPKSSDTNTPPSSAARLGPNRTHIEGRWTKEEDRKLRAAVKEMGGRNWKRISAIAFGGLRSDVQCLHRWQKVLRPGLHKGPWSPEEDRIVLDFVEKCGGVSCVKWSVVAAQVKGRLGKQVRERWYNHLDPTLKKGPWEPEEDKLLLELQKSMGNRWCEIAKNIPGRSENAVKNRWNSAQRRARAKAGIATKKAAAAGKKASKASSSRTPTDSKKPRAQSRVPGKKTPGTRTRGRRKKAPGEAGTKRAAGTRKRKGACNAGTENASKPRKRGRKSVKSAVEAAAKSRSIAANLSVIADIGAALQMCDIQMVNAGVSPMNSPTRPITPPIGSRTDRVSNSLLMAAAFQRPGHKASSHGVSGAAAQEAASALLGLF